MASPGELCTGNDAGGWNEKQQGVPDSGERKSRSLARSELPAEN